MVICLIIIGLHRHLRDSHKEKRKQQHLHDLSMYGRRENLHKVVEVLQGVK